MGCGRRPRGSAPRGRPPGAPRGAWRVKLNQTGESGDTHLAQNSEARIFILSSLRLLYRLRCG